MGALIADDLLFPAEAGPRQMARDLYAAVRSLPIVSPHGHTDPRWYALDEPFPDPAQLLIERDRKAAPKRDIGIGAEAGE